MFMNTFQNLALAQHQRIRLACIKNLALGGFVFAQLLGCAKDEGTRRTGYAIGEISPFYAVKPGATFPKANFRTKVSGHYLAAENGGGGAVKANKTVAQSWETFEIVDQNGGSLDHGDQVYIRTANGQYLQVSNGTGTALNAASLNRFRKSI